MIVLVLFELLLQSKAKYSNGSAIFLCFPLKTRLCLFLKKGEGNKYIYIFTHYYLTQLSKSLKFYIF